MLGVLPLTVREAESSPSISLVLEQNDPARPIIFTL
jgi:hypothetical protein